MFCVRTKWPIRPKLKPVSSAWSDWEHIYSPLYGTLVLRRGAHAWKLPLAIYTDWWRGALGAPGALPSNGFPGMCRWMESNFHNWTDYNGVSFSGILNRVTRMAEWSRTFSRLRRKTFTQKWLRLSGVNNWPQNRPEIDYNGIGVLRCQQHIPSKTWDK